jgi:hypothetical protein
MGRDCGDEKGGSAPVKGYGPATFRTPFGKGRMGEWEKGGVGERGTPVRVARRRVKITLVDGEEVGGHWFERVEDAVISFSRSPFLRFPLGHVF